ncbi:hypothetical protein Tco_0670497 [Tanacetum coccineum]
MSAFFLPGDMVTQKLGITFWGFCFSLVVLQVVTKGVNMLDLDVAVMFVVIICFDLQVKIPVMNIADRITKPAITITRALHNAKSIQIILILLLDDDNLMRWKEQLLRAVAYVTKH